MTDEKAALEKTILRYEAEGVAARFDIAGDELLALGDMSKVRVDIESGRVFGLEDAAADLVRLKPYLAARQPVPKQPEVPASLRKLYKSMGM